MRPSGDAFERRRFRRHSRSCFGCWFGRVFRARAPASRGRKRPGAAAGKSAVVAGWRRRAGQISASVRRDTGTVHFGSWQTGRLRSKGMRQFGTGPAHSSDTEFRLIDRHSPSTCGGSRIPDRLAPFGFRNDDQVDTPEPINEFRMAGRRCSRIASAGRPCAVDDRHRVWHRRPRLIVEVVTSGLGTCEPKAASPLHRKHGAKLPEAPAARPFHASD
jgi:hypothetical protein